MMVLLMLYVLSDQKLKIREKSKSYDLNELLLPDGSLWLVYASKKTLHFVYSGQVFNEHKRSQYKQSQGAFFSYKFIKETKK